MCASCGFASASRALRAARGLLASLPARRQSSTADGQSRPLAPQRLRAREPLPIATLPSLRCSAAPHSLAMERTSAAPHAATAAHLFAQVIREREGDYSYSVALSIVEVYNENVRDLLEVARPSGAGGMPSACLCDVQRTPVARCSASRAPRCRVCVHRSRSRSDRDARPRPRDMACCTAPGRRRFDRSRRVCSATTTGLKCGRTRRARACTCTASRAFPSVRLPTAQRRMPACAGLGTPRSPSCSRWLVARPRAVWQRAAWDGAA